MQKSQKINVDPEVFAKSTPLNGNAWWTDTSLKWLINAKRNDPNSFTTGIALRENTAYPNATQLKPADKLDKSMDTATTILVIGQMLKDGNVSIASNRDRKADLPNGPLDLEIRLTEQGMSESQKE